MAGQEEVDSVADSILDRNPVQFDGEMLDRWVDAWAANYCAHADPDPPVALHD